MRQDVRALHSPPRSCLLRLTMHAKPLLPYRRAEFVTAAAVLRDCNACCTEESSADIRYAKATLEVCE